MARVNVKDEAGPTAFDVSLNLDISTARHSPRECDPTTVVVNAETKVHWLFKEGACIWHHVHGCDSNQLQEDFDIYLIRTDRDAICLHPSHKVADYGIKKGDNLQLRHKTNPITVCVNIHSEHKSNIEVNSGFSVMDIAHTICEKLGIRNDQELSLAFVLPSNSEQVSNLSWLDGSSSLKTQAVKDGDTLLLRKKFFILNDDIHEAIEGNEVLLELVYYQIHDLYLTEKFIGREEKVDTLAKVSALLHHIEQGDPNISDAVGKMTPRNRHGNTSFFTQVVTTYYQEGVDTLQKEEARNELLKMFCEHQSIILTHYPVKTSEESDDYLLAVDSEIVTVCEEREGQLKVVDSMSWQLKDLRNIDHTHKGKMITLNVLGSQQELFTSYTTQITNHLMEAHMLLKKKIARERFSYRLSSPTSPEPAKSPSWLEEQKEKQEEGLNVLGVIFESPVVAVTASPVQEFKVWVKEEGQAPDTRAKASSISPRSRGKRPTHVLKLDPAKPPKFISKPPHTPVPMVEEVQKYSSRSIGAAASNVVHIPEYLTLSYRKVLRDYRLFHIVIFKQDIRTLLLHIRKPVREIIDTVCGTFNIRKQNDYHLWIPTEIQAIIEKYGGHPNFRDGQYVGGSSSFAGNFPAWLDMNKPLEDQYNFDIKPYLLHLRRYQLAEETDADKEVDCGQEWPDCENPGHRAYRQFYQLAALLIRVDQNPSRVWPQEDNNIKCYLPGMYQNVFGITAEVQKVYKDLLGKSVRECMNMAAECCAEMLPFQGLLFDVMVPVKPDILEVIPRNKIKRRLFGINHHRIVSISRKTGKILFTHRLSNVRGWECSENKFCLFLVPETKLGKPEYKAYAYQAPEIIEALELFTGPTFKGRTKHLQPHLPSVTAEESQSLLPASPQLNYDSTNVLPKLSLREQVDDGFGPEQQKGIHNQPVKETEVEDIFAPGASISPVTFPVPQNNNKEDRKQTPLVSMKTKEQQTKPFHQSVSIQPSRDCRDICIQAMPDIQESAVQTMPEPAKQERMPVPEELDWCYHAALQCIRSRNKEIEELRKQLHQSHFHGTHTNMETTGYLRGVDVVGETSLLISNQAQTFHWAGYGLKLHISQDSLPAGLEECTLYIKVGLSGQFAFPHNTSLVSAVYWIDSKPRCKFSKHIRMELQHCSKLNQSSKLSIVRAKCSQEILPYTFTPIEEGEFSLHELSSYGSIKLSHFSMVSVVQEKGEDPQYCARLYYSRKKPTLQKVYFVITKDLEVFDKAISKYLSGAASGVDSKLEFESDQVSLDIPQKGMTEKGWLILPLTPPVVTKKEVDTFTIHRRIPSCHIRLQWVGSGPQVDLYHQVTLIGAMEPYNWITIETDVDPLPQLSTQDMCSKYPSGLESEPELKDLMNEVAAMIPNKWEDIGIQLKVSDGDLAHFAQSQSVNHFLSVFKAWRDKQTSPYTWKTLLDALQTPVVGENKLAEDIHSKINK